MCLRFCNLLGTRLGRSIFALFVAATLVPMRAHSQRARIQVLYGGSADSEASLTLIRHLAVNDRGIVFVDERNQRVTFLSHKGQHVRSWGRAGAGPGEFELPGRIGFRGDSIWVRDAANDRITFFNHNGRVLRVSTHRPTDGNRESSPAPSTLLADKLALALPSFSVAPGAQVPTTPLLLVTEDGVIQDTLARVPMSHARWIITDPKRKEAQKLRIYAPNPFAGGAMYDATSDGQYASWATYAMRPGEMRVDVAVLSVRGKRTTRFSVPYRPVPISAKLIEEVVDERVSRLKSVPSPFSRIPDKRLREWARAGLTHPNHLEPVTALVIAADGERVLVRRELRAGSESVWEAYDMNGERVRRFTLPKQAEILEARGDTIWGVLPDSLNVPAIIRATLPSGAKGR